MSALDDLSNHLHRIHALERAGDVLRWDQETTMPPGGIEARAGELSQLASAVHDRWTSETTARLVDEARSQADEGREQALVREAAWIHERKTRVPEPLVQEISEATSRAHAAWVEAKQADDFDAFAEHLERIVDLKRRYAEAVDPGRDLYPVLFEDFEPWLPLDRALTVVDEVAQGSRKLLERAPDPEDQAEADALAGPWPVDAQHALVEDLLAELGFDFDRGVIGEAEHPFSIGNRYDARIATHLYEDDLLSGLTSSVHEFGHASYTQGLPEEGFGTPLGNSRDLVVHESQSRLWENHVARSLPFWRFLAGPLEKRMGRSVEPEAAWRAANVVQPSLIRVDADEVSYHLHIKLRLDLERRLITGDLAVDELPEAWNDGMEELLGIRPPNDREGVLQDVHWSHGSIGYFPTYTLGSALAAQVADALEDDIGSLTELVEERAFDEIRAWLRENVHRHGARYETDDLIEEATGGPLSADPFLDHAERRFGKLWKT